MKQNEILAAILIGIFVAVFGWIITTSFVAKPEERQEEVQLVRPFTTEFNPQATVYLNSSESKVYTVDLNVEQSVGPGNKQPFSGN